MAQSSGFTLIELMIVIAIVAVIAAIAVPNLQESRITANEAKVAASLRSGFHPAQELFRSSGCSDWDSDGVGEYARDVQFLAGATTTPPAHVGETTVPFHSLPPAFAAAGDPVRVDDYLFAIHIAYNIPGAVDGAERYYGAFARPAQWNHAGRRGFAMLQDGQVLATTLSVAPGTVWTDADMRDMYEVTSSECLFSNTYTMEAGVASAYLVAYRR
ncbi:MAG: prepilin-type N-terminal cleavage/methylation domain-containing protein [Planctomycetota bacterium]